MTYQETIDDSHRLWARSEPALDPVQEIQSHPISQPIDWAVREVQTLVMRPNFGEKYLPSQLETITFA